MASKRLLNNVYLSGVSCTQYKLVPVAQFCAPPIRLKYTSTSYTREKKLNPVFKPRWEAPRAMEINRRRERVAQDQRMRNGTEKVVRRSQFTDWNYSAELNAFQARVGEQFDEEKLWQSFKTREYLEASTLEHGKVFGIEKENSLNQLGGNPFYINLITNVFIPVNFWLTTYGPLPSFLCP